MAAVEEPGARRETAAALCFSPTRLRLPPSLPSPLCAPAQAASFALSRFVFSSCDEASGEIGAVTFRVTVCFSRYFLSIFIEAKEESGAASLSVAPPPPLPLLRPACAVSRTGSAAPVQRRAEERKTIDGYRVGVGGSSRSHALETCARACVRAHPRRPGPDRSELAVVRR